MYPIKSPTIFLTAYLTSLLSLWSFVLPVQVIAQDLPKSGLAPGTDSGGTNAIQLPPVDTGDGTESGATRGSCIQIDEHWRHIIPLIPESNIGQTLIPNPTFFFYLPQTSAKSAQFILKDENNHEVYKTTFDIPITPGIISIKMPDSGNNVASLAVGQDYHWDFSLICNAQNRKNDLVVKGWVRRIELEATIQSKLKDAKLSDRIAIYQENNVWHDALTALAELRIKNPNDSTVEADWENLLRSFGLNEIAKEPIIEP